MPKRGQEHTLPTDSQALQAAYLDLEAILHATADELFVTDGHGTTLRVSLGCERYYGVEAEQLTGRSVHELEEQGLFTPSATSLALKEKRRVSILQTTVNGRRLLVKATPFTGFDGQVHRVVCNSIDVTDLLTLQTQLADAEELVRRYQDELIATRMGEYEVSDEILHIPGLRNVFQMAQKVAQVDSTVLLTGESGAGKDVFAQLIHKSSPRREGPFVRVNCGAIPEHLLESELFGYERGAFTNARKEGRVGYFELANGGTLFLNEVSELPLPLQVKLLQALQDRQFFRVGGSKPVKVNVRFIAASNRNLKEMVDTREFRQDLYYRLNVVPIFIPPLRSRTEDILPLARFSLDRFNQRLGLQKWLDEGAEQQLLQYTWPGNARELENVVERLVVMTDGPVITGSDINAVLYHDEQIPTQLSAEPPSSLKQKLEEVEGRLIRDAYERLGSSYEVARELGISQASAFRRIQKYVKSSNAG